MTFERWAAIRRVLEVAVAVGAVFALAAIGVCALQGFWFLQDCRSSVKAMGRLTDGLQAQVEHLGTVTLPAAEQTIHSADDLIQQGSTLTRNVDRRITDTSQNLNAILIQAGLAADQIQQASIEQKQYWEKISGDTDETLKTLNSGARGFDQNMQEIAKLVADPHLKDTFAQADGILTDTHAMTSAALPAVKRYASPPTRKQRIIQNVKDFGAMTYIGLKIAFSIP